MKKKTVFLLPCLVAFAASATTGMGDASMFTADDLDYAGNLRLREGRLDPGCFECWLNITSTRVIFR